MMAALLAQVNPNPWTTIVWLMMGAIGFFALIASIFLAKYFNLWIQAKMTLANVTIWELVGMSFRKVNPNIIVRSKIMAYQAGLSEKDGMTTRALEAHYLAGGNVPNVVRALIAANRADIPLSYKRAAAIDLAGRNVLEAVQTSVNPKVIPCPDPSSGRQTIDGVAKNGIQLKVKAKVTVRTNLDRLVGGATDETIIARVGEGIVNAIGSAETHLQVLEKPDTISKRVLEKGLDAGTAYEILSIDIADIDVGDNIGANLQAFRPRPTRGWPAPRPRNGEPSRWPKSRKCRRPYRKTAPRSCGPRPRSPWRSPRRSGREIWASSIITICKTFRPTPICVARSPAPATLAARTCQSRRERAVRRATPIGTGNTRSRGPHNASIRRLAGDHGALGLDLALESRGPAAAAAPGPRPGTKRIATCSRPPPRRRDGSVASRQFRRSFAPRPSSAACRVAGAKPRPATRPAPAVAWASMMES